MMCAMHAMYVIRGMDGCMHGCMYVILCVSVATVMHVMYVPFVLHVIYGMCMYVNIYIYICVYIYIYIPEKGGDESQPPRNADRLFCAQR